jgi:heterotetrameric sarcosine oxidase gamma subunit
VAELAAVARSPIPLFGRPEVVAGWEVSEASQTSSAADLELVDCMPLTKVLVRAAAGGAVAELLKTPLGRTSRRFSGVLTTACRPEEWALYGVPGSAQRLIVKVRNQASQEEHVTVLDITHGRALVRLTGNKAPEVLCKLCGIDLSDTVTPSGAALRTSVAKLTVELVRDDRDGVCSYLMSCDRSYGGYFFDALLDAGTEFAIEPRGFSLPGI